MSAILSYVNNWFFPKSSLTDENVVECPICYTSCKKFKEMHANSKNQPPHFACIPCRQQLFEYWDHPNCPVCNQPIYTSSYSYYFRCDLCGQTKKEVAETYLSHFKTHKDHIFCTECIKTLKSCPVCNYPITPDNPWS